jgi:hypothetical protein
MNLDRNRPIIFLDIDGVLAVDITKYRETKWGDIYPFNLKCCLVFNKIIEETNAQVVLSTDWALKFSLADMREIFDWNAIVCDIIDKTPDNPMYKEADTLEFMSGARITEINQWLTDNNWTGKWVCIDDLPFHHAGNYELVEDHFIHCPRWLEGIKQSGLKDKIVKLLK